MTESSRRDFMKGMAAFGAGAGLMVINPEILVSGAAAQAGKQLVFLSAENITGNWDPTAHTTLSQKNIEGFVMGFLTRTPMRVESPDEVIYELATKITLLEPTKLEIKLREGVKFHDGKPFKAEDVKATFEYGSQPDRPAQWYPGPTETLTITTPDDYTVIVDTSKGGYPAHLFIFLASYLPMLSATDIAAGPSGPLSQRLNGTGPYKFVEQRGNDTVLEAYPGYFLGAPTIPGISFNFVGDSTTRMLSLMNGQASIVERLEPEQVATLKGNENVAISSVVSVENKYLWFRCSKPPFDDPRVRMAACHAIDRSMLLEILGEAGHASANYVSPVKFGYVDLPNYPEYSPEKCQALLAEAGFPKGQGLPELEYITSVGFYPKTKEYGEVITAMLQEQGFPVTLSVLEIAAWNERLYDRPGGGPGHMVDCGWSTGSPEPDLVLRTHFHSSSKRITGIVDPELDASLDKERSAASLEERKQILQTETMPMIAAKVPSFSLFTSVMIHAMDKSLTGLFIYPDGSMDASKGAFA
ncbi:ABC transporter substrate-binding protein [Mesorhizobium sp. M6A.T.Ce.TU.002.03.1.1]|uniref:ABC transporter substrate-binding protein n=1 Tax=Mesorhizobium sp. M6A.T.Ce.TU.002.03.1.1 TaxID=2496782 RepID=UPI000FCC9071|nr:ABC transporter substrate-binding protein [Mesorhizobium sp. M6A.T.Ce.TU.002.03.1.1]RUU42685.1 ABC transporter substrate-binding protein [Mesorhizobium sp. M6A.T.Ce.TU.002.03.1.1]